MTRLLTATALIAALTPCRPRLRRRVGPGPQPNSMRFSWIRMLRMSLGHITWV
jgi:hypothetical protein